MKAAVKTVWRPLLALAAVSTLGACSLFGSDEPKPAPLASYQPSIAGRVVWGQKLGTIDFPLQIAAPATGVFVVADGSGQVRALRSLDGAEAWRVDVGAKLSAGVGSDGRWSAVVTRNQELVVLEGGRVAWRQRLNSPVVTAPLVAGERVFVLGVDRAVHGFDALDGRRLFETRRPGDALMLSQPGGLVAVKDTLVVGQGPRLAGLDPVKGTVRWEAAVASPRGANEVERLADVVAPVVRVGDAVCARAFQVAVGCVNAQRGSQIWSRPNAGALGVGGDGTVVVGVDASDRLQAWKLENGDTLWVNEDYKHRKMTAPVLTGTTVVLGDVQGWVHFLDRSSGKVLRRVQAGTAPIVTPAAVSGTTLLVAARDGGLHALRPE